MTDDDRAARVTAAEPVANHGDKAAGDQAAHGRTPRDDAAAQDEIDADTAGDGVAFFEGGDGREEARGDIERSG